MAGIWLAVLCGGSSTTGTRGAAGQILASSLIGLISSRDNKRNKEAIWMGKGKDVNAGQVHAMILMLLASIILVLHLPPNQDTTKYSAIKKVQIGLGKELAHDYDEFETFSCYVDSD